MKISDFLLGAGMGAVAMYLLDPQNGTSRRAQGRVKALNAAAKSRDALKNNPIADRMLAERVRSQIVHSIKHPAAIDIDVRNGCVVLSGPIPSAELPQVLEEVAGIKGVTEVENHLEAHEEPGDPPGL